MDRASFDVPPRRGRSEALTRAGISICVVLAALMQALDTTIANIALPHIQGAVSASQDQINWVLTSYIVAAAIFTPPTGFLAQRLGLKRLFLVAIGGFVAASALCGIATSLTQIVGFRLLQGAFGAALVPLSQSTMLEMAPKERQGRAMALWAMAAMIGPILGPVLGGWLTENYSWRWCFYINLPIGAIALAGIWWLMPPARPDEVAHLDWFGFAMLSAALASLQLLLDRGQQLDWFGSREIVVEVVIAAVAFYLFLVHIATARAPFIRLALFKNRNFTAGLLMIFAVGGTYLASFALLTPYLQNLMGYPIVTAGLVMGPRGLAMMAIMLVVGRLIGRVDIRLLVGTGLGLVAWSLYQMTAWTPDISIATVVINGLIQGVGLGFLMVPISTTTLATLPAEFRTEGAGLFSLSRNIGASIGISVMTALLARNIQINHAEIVQHVTVGNRLIASNPLGVFSPFTAAGRAALNGLVTRQAEIIAYMDDFKLMMILTLSALPLVLIFRPTKSSGRDSLPMAIE